MLCGSYRCSLASEETEDAVPLQTAASVAPFVSIVGHIRRLLIPENSILSASLRKAENQKPLYISTTQKNIAMGRRDAQVCSRRGEVVPPLPTYPGSICCKDFLEVNIPVSIPCHFLSQWPLQWSQWARTRSCSHIHSSTSCVCLLKNKRPRSMAALEGKALCLHGEPVEIVHRGTTMMDL